MQLKIEGNGLSLLINPKATFKKALIAVGADGLRQLALRFQKKIACSSVWTLCCPRQHTYSPYSIECWDRGSCWISVTTDFEQINPSNGQVSKRRPEMSIHSAPSKCERCWAHMDIFTADLQHPHTQLTSTMQQLDTFRTRWAMTIQDVLVDQHLHRISFTHIPLYQCSHLGAVSSSWYRALRYCVEFADM